MEMIFGILIFYYYICIVKLLELKFMNYKVGDKVRIRETINKKQYGRFN